MDVTSLSFAVWAAALPMIIYLGVIWWLDRYEREPFWMVALTFGYGALFAIAFSLVGTVLVTRFFGIDPTDMTATATWVAPLVEEPGKASILFLLLLSRHFDNTTDGLIYGAAVGLGFAMTENFLYFRKFQLAGDSETTLVGL